MATRNRAIQTLAKTLYRDLIDKQGFSEREIVSLATELIGNVTSDMSTQSATGD